MHLLTQSTLLRALGWTLLNSLWQMGLFWFLYHVLILVFGDISARIRHGLALLFLASGTLWSAWSLISAGRGTISGFPIPTPVRHLIITFLPYGSSVYLVILTGLLTRYCYYFFYSKKLSREGLTRIEPRFRIFVAETSRRMGIRPEVKVWLSKLIDVPVTLGFLKPVILLPFTMAGHLTSDQVEAILVHELAHIRRNDFFLNLGVTLLEGLFFFNPFARSLIGDLKKEREYHCDDWVLQFRYDPQAYVSALLSVARQASQHRQTRLALAATGSGNDQLLLQRSKRILLQQRTGDRPRPMSFVLLLLTLLISLVTLSRSARSQPEKVSSPPLVITRVLMTKPVTYPEPKISKRVDQPRLPPRHPAQLPAPDDRRDEDQADAKTLLLSNAIARAGLTSPAELVADIRKDTREYSIGKSQPASPAPDLETEQPFVPKSSWVFLSIDADTLRPEEKLARIQVQTQQDIALNMQKLQLDLMAQLELIKARQRKLQEEDLSENIQGLKEQQALIEEQLRLQRTYMQKLDELQKRLKKLSRHFTIVYI